MSHGKIVRYLEADCRLSQMRRDGFRGRTESVDGLGIRFRASFKKPPEGGFAYYIKMCQIGTLPISGYRQAAEILSRFLYSNHEALRSCILDHLFRGQYARNIQGIVILIICLIVLHNYLP